MNKNARELAALKEAYNLGYTEPEEGCPQDYDEDLQESWLKGAMDLKVDLMAYFEDQNKEEPLYENDTTE